MFEYASRAVGLVGEFVAGDVLFVWEPLFHIGGAQLLLLPLVHDVHLHMVPRFSASRFWDQVRDSGATHIHYLGGILQMLLRQPPNELDKHHQVRIAWGGGCPPDVLHRFEDRFACQVRECYGMTEASSMTTINIDGPTGSVGRPVPWLEVEVLDEAGREVPVGDRGQITVSEHERGALFDGYSRDAAASSKALVAGKFHTGDSGSFDENGYLFFHGRLNDSVRYRGENISAWEVENGALQHPAIAEAAMVGVDADIGEQEIKLFVVLHPGKDVSADALSEWLTTTLGRYRSPRYIEFAESLPKTPSERVRKGLLSRDTANCWDRDEAKERTLTAGAQA